ncbi:hypothetical protein [Mangrovicoccus sp. HB161399]|uniref:hypothetical protein n=1 Tax=Mangrovicoccus sp. HB161399 TaxID=2720392 RepID=UPI001556774F|nr:hypothetical protein [Mangrovicoccus sp. HB161399]
MTGPTGPHPGIDHDLTGKLLSTGTTLLGLMFPVLVATIGLLRAPTLLSIDEPGLVRIAAYVSGALALCMLQLMACLAALSGRGRTGRLPLWLTVILIFYVSLGTVIWALAEMGVPKWLF